MRPSERIPRAQAGQVVIVLKLIEQPVHFRPDVLRVAEHAAALVDAYSAEPTRPSIHVLVQVAVNRLEAAEIGQSRVGLNLFPWWLKPGEARHCDLLGPRLGKLGQGRKLSRRAIRGITARGLDHATGYCTC